MFIMKIIIAGEGGQGVQAIANIMTEAAYNQGKQALYIPNFGVEQRGGVSVAFIQIDDKEISSLKFTKADLVLALSPRAVTRTLQYSDSRTIFLYEADIAGVDLPQTAAQVRPIAAMQIVKEKLNTRVFNVLIMGAAIAASKVVDMDYVIAALEHNLKDKFKKNPALRQMNLEALRLGSELVS